MKTISLLEAFLKSLFIHLGLVAFVVGSAYISRFQTVDMAEVHLIQSAVRVDVVDMPDKTLKELARIDLSKQLNPSPAKAPKEEKIKEAPPEKESQSKNEYEVANKDAKVVKDLLKDLSKKEVKRDKKEEPKEEKANKSDLRDLIVSGNKLSHGSNATGDVNTSEQTAIDSYASSILSRIKEYWRLPQSELKRKDLRARVMISIGPDGRLQRFVFAKKSGNANFDSAVEDVFEKVGSFPRPPKEIKKNSLTFELVFPLEN